MHVSLCATSILTHTLSLAMCFWQCQAFMAGLLFIQPLGRQMEHHWIQACSEWEHPLCTCCVSWQNSREASQDKLKMECACWWVQWRLLSRKSQRTSSSLSSWQASIQYTRCRFFKRASAAKDELAILVTWEINNTGESNMAFVYWPISTFFPVEGLHKLLGDQKVGGFYKYFKIRKSRKLCTN